MVSPMRTGNRRNAPRRTAEAREDQELPTMFWDYMEQRGKDGKVMEAEYARNELILNINGENKWISAMAAKTKELDAHAVEAMGKNINNS